MHPYLPKVYILIYRECTFPFTEVVHYYLPISVHCYLPITLDLGELAHAIQLKLRALNDKPYKNSAYSRLYLYEQYERNTMRSLPEKVFTHKKLVLATVQRNYHIQLSQDHLYYSVPYTYVGKKVKVLYDNHTVEVYFEYSRIALHIRKSTNKAYTTLPEHMPANHLHMHKVKGWTRESLLSHAAKIGQYTRHAAEHMLDNSIYVEQNYKACFGMLMLEKKYTACRLEAACQRACNGTRINYTMIRNILQKGLGKQALLFDNHPLPQHENIRGADHYR